MVRMMLSTRSRGRGKTSHYDRIRPRTKRRVGVRQEYVRIKQGNGQSDDIIDLADSSEEREDLQRMGFNVRSFCKGDGTCVDMLELLSDADDEGDDDSDAETVDLTNNAPPPLCPTSRGSTFYLESPRATVDLTRPRNTRGGLLCEYEQIYIDLAQSSSSDDYESTDSSDESQGETNDSDDDEKTVPRALANRPRPTVSSARVNKKVVQNTVCSDITKLEMRKPWRYVYRCLEIPFESTPRTDTCGFMFERWDDFWRDHGRAVWERMYWKPMSKHSEAYRERHNRQCRAAKAFRRLATDLHDKFGIKLIELVKVMPHSGWWYRSKRPVDLVRLRCQDSRLYALHLSRYRERWPFGVRHVRLHCNSCWCLPEVTVPDDKEIDISSDSDSDDSL